MRFVELVLDACFVKERLEYNYRRLLLNHTGSELHLAPDFSPGGTFHLTESKTRTGLGGAGSAEFAFCLPEGAFLDGVCPVYIAARVRLPGSLGRGSRSGLEDMGLGLCFLSFGYLEVLLPP